MGRDWGAELEASELLLVAETLRDIEELKDAVYQLSAESAFGILFEGGVDNA